MLANERVYVETTLVHNRIYVDYTPEMHSEGYSGDGRG